MDQLKSKYSPSVPFITALAATLIIFSCSDNRNPENKKNNTPAQVTYVKPPSSFNDTLIISDKSAVFFNPDSLQLEKIKGITENMIYESNVHDCFYQMRNARLVLKKDWPKIRIIETAQNRYLLFVKSDKTKTCIDLNSRGDMCGIYLFDTAKEPEFADMMNIDTALGFYFSH
jgi:hypothetical protein